MAVSGRKELGPTVSLAIAETRDPAAMRALLENNTCKLSDRAVELIVSASRKARDLCPLLASREEVRPAHALAMFWWCEAPERRAVLLRFSAERTLLIDMCADIFRYAAADSDPVVRKALQVIERRQRNRLAIEKSAHASLEAAIQAAAQKGIDPDAMVDISNLSGIKPSTGERIFRDPGGEGLAVLCKATGLKRQFLRDLWTALGREATDRSSDFDRVSELYETIAVAKAQTVLRYWNWSLSSAYSPDGIDEDALIEDADPFAKAMRTIDDLMRPKAVGYGR